MKPNPFALTVGVLVFCLYLEGGCSNKPPGSDDSVSVLSASERVAEGEDDRKAQGEDDRTPRYLSHERAQVLLEAPLRLLREIPLEMSADEADNFFARAFFATSSSIYLLEGRSRSIYEFEHSGRLIRRFGQLPAQEERIKRGNSLDVGPRSHKLYVADGDRILEFDKAGNFAGILQLPGVDYAYAVKERDNGDLLVRVSLLRGPYWALFRRGELARHFFSQRRELLPPDQEFLVATWPHSLAEIDGAGNIYVVGQAPYQIRKYDSSATYLGDFAFQEDTEVVPPPDRLDPEVLQQWHITGTWKPFWSIVKRIALVKDKYLVVSLIQRDAKIRLHFYTLDGRQAFKQAFSDSPLSGRDREGNLYFRKWTPGRLSLLVYSLEE